MCPQDLKSDFVLARIRILLCMQKVLLGEVIPALRGVTIGWDDTTISGLFYYDCPITDDIGETVDELETLVIAEFPDCKVDFKAVHNSQKLPDGLMEWVYLRAE